MALMETFGYQLKKVRPQQFAIIEENIADVQEFGIKINFGYGFDFNDRLFSVEIAVTIQHNEEVAAKSSMILDFELTFNDKPLELNSLQLPAQFVSHVSQTAYDTIRGYMLARTENTPTSSIILPLFNCDLAMKDNKPLSFSKS